MRVAPTKKLTPLFLDFETFWSVDFTLRKIPTGDYVRDEQFQIHCVAAKLGKGKTKLFTDMDKFQEYLDSLDADNIVLVGHNLYFDGLICTEIFDFVPAAYHCTMSMSRGLWRNTCAHGLDPMCKRLGLKGKVKAEALTVTKGRRTEELTKQELKNLGAYCVDDINDTAEAYWIMLPYMPDIEMEIISHTVRCFVEPLLIINAELLEEAIIEVEERRAELLDRIGNFVTTEFPDITDVGKALRSRKQFPAMLESLGIEVPLKVSPRTGKPTYALAMKDPEYMALCDDEDPIVRLLCECRNEFASNQTMTRAGRLLSATKGGGTLPIMYLYCGAHTMRWSASGKMNLQNLQRGSKLRKAIEAPPGYVLMVGDSGQIEARFTAWIAGQRDLVQAFVDYDRDPKRFKDAYCIFASDAFGRDITKDDEIERFVGKTCVAEGSLVLTDQGLVPIEKVTIKHKLWDGVEWVTHDGVIYKGYQDVITYDGLTATADHQVHTEGRADSIPFGIAASQMERLVRSGDGGQEIRVSDDYRSTYYSAERLHVCDDPVHDLREQEADKPEQLREGNFSGLSVVLTDKIEAFKNSWSAVRRYYRSLYEPAKSGVSKIRRARSQESFCLADGVHSVCGKRTTSRFIPWIRDRSDRQQRALRTGKSAFSNEEAKHAEPREYCEDFIPGGNDSPIRVRESIQLWVDVQANETRDDGGTDSGAKKAHVYDILNAGPRHRFTVQNRLILNCILGLGFGMGWKKLLTTLFLAGVEMPPHEVQRIHGLYRTQYAKIVALWQKLESILAAMAAGGEGRIELAEGQLVLEYEADKVWMPNGLALHYPGLRARYDDEGRQTGFEFLYTKGQTTFWKSMWSGQFCENIVQCLARIAVAEQIVQIARRYRVVMTTHDEAVMLVKKDKTSIAAAQQFMIGAMSVPPEWAQTIPIATEVKYAANYSK